MRFRRTVYLWHRYLGIVLCLFIAMWFASGIVMMYVLYPSLDEHKRLSGLPKLESESVLPPSAILKEYPDAETLRFNAVLGHPVYHVETNEARYLLDARSGEVLQPGREAMVEAARRHSSAEIAKFEEISVDQWSVPERYNGHRPLTRVRMDDSKGTWLYLSSTTGEVVQEATRFQRGWSWVGSVPHWIYPWQLRQHRDLWVQVVIWLSSFGLLLVISGTLVGFWRLRVLRRYKGNRMTPYRGWQRWHHLLGLTSVLFVFTFLVSGLFSMNPGKIFTSPPSDAEAGEAPPTWSDGALGDDAFATLDSLDLDGARELEWRRDAGRSILLLHHPDETRVRRADGSPLTFDRSELKRRANKLLPAADVVEATRLDDYDNYYYGRHKPKPLPVLRILFDDPLETALYINLENGAIESRADQRKRWKRWLYNGLHSLDVPFLWERRPLWDVVVLSLMVIGLTFSLTGVVLGWRRLICITRY